MSYAVWVQGEASADDALGSIDTLVAAVSRRRSPRRKQVPPFFGLLSVADILIVVTPLTFTLI
ncbi:MAG: hypothetical protein FWF28_09525, partial [Micrococcales bacterium]|nr:hypothetical protein [Micrococcales bacterium]